VSKADAAEPGDPSLPEPVRELILRRIDSVAELEALLLLFNEPQRPWEVSAVARRLYIGEAQATAALRHLHSRGLARAQDDRWRFEPDEPALTDVVRALSELYTQRLVVITALIHGKTGRGIEEFARAFVLRRKD
jgi:Mn-dependent DtxR family transcriptional regulator